MTQTTPSVTDTPIAAQLRAAIATSGLSARQYARTVLLRDERTLRRWLSGERPIPQVVRRFLDPPQAP